MSPELPPESPSELTANIQVPRCPSCRQPVAPEARFCSFCGVPLGEDNTGTFTPLSAGATPAVEDSGPLPVVDPDLVASIAEGDAVLIVHKGPNEGARFELTTSPISVGRAPKSTIFLDDVTVSRSHAKFSRSESGWRLEDAGSLNGTYVNRSRIDSHALVSGDEVQIGKYRFLFFQAEAS